MKGRPTLWLPGTDHAGIATQWQWRWWWLPRRWLIAPHPQTLQFAPPLPQSPLLPPVNYIVVVVAAATVVDWPPQTPPSVLPVPQLPLPPPVNYTVAVALVVAAAAVVDCPPSTNTAVCATITTITFASTS
ncbi:Valine--tRNA ligase, chloroplastic/mitochondrial 2 [Senna tora]|uniref:Valine--tRNA ligase, chloroplastic/mitochondrial 2 n=1 Tax=Senna tora TaxID=362788 RepID=A0A835CAB3_9FABA|nr:Valine--tRNA ligase, chloroplastic/mitochondrial 2 [Senna tora]